MWMSSRAPLTACMQSGARTKRERGSAGAMMSPSPANKLGLTLWGPWRKGEGMEWECGVATLQNDIHGRWEAAVMLGEGRRGSFMNPWWGWRAADPSCCCRLCRQRGRRFLFEQQRQAELKVLISDPGGQRKYKRLGRGTLLRVTTLHSKSLKI